MASGIHTRGSARGPLAALVLLATLVVQPGCTRLLYNFGTVEPQRVYRSSQPSPLFLRYLVEHQGVRSLVNLRGRTPGFESDFAARHGLKLFSFDLSASRPPSQAEVMRFLEIVSDPANQPVLVHCRNGVDRTGYMLGLYRIEADGWSPERAAREMSRYLQFGWLNPTPKRVVEQGLRATPETSATAP